MHPLNPELSRTASHRQRCNFLAQGHTPQRPGFDIEFRDSLRLRYNLPLQEIPSTCACAELFNVSQKSEKCLPLDFVTMFVQKLLLQ